MLYFYRSAAVQHIDRTFIADFVKSVRKETNEPKMFAVGEFWKDSIEDLEAYLQALDTQVSDIFLCSFHYLRQFSLMKSPKRPVQRIRRPSALQLQRSGGARSRL